MRGNSGFLRWLPSSNCRTTSTASSGTAALVIILFIATASLNDAGPVSSRHRRMIREVYSELESKPQNITQLVDGTCIQDGIQVPKASVHCEKKAGCRAIQKTGYCCPDYQCECEREGKIYGNGEKLVDPETPCKVCYCQGGEILCSSVTCYIRNDCEPKYISGRCCPEYDNCPPLESGRPHLNNPPSTTTVVPTSHVSLEDITVSAVASSKPEAANNNPLGIKIKEITKPEEIRIIDEKPKPTYQIIKPMEVSSTNQQKIFTTSLSKEETPVTSVETSHPLNEMLPTSIEAEISSSQVVAIEGSTSEAPNKLESADANSITDEDTQKIVRNTDSLEETEDNSTLSLPSSSEQPTLEKENPEEIGKEVVIVDSNGQTKPITVFGVEGLQRGDVPDEVGEYDEKKTAAKRSDTKFNESDSVQDATTEGLGYVFDNSTGPELIYENNSGGEHFASNTKTESDFDAVGSSSDDFVRIISTTRNGENTFAESTTEGYSSKTSSISSLDIYTSDPDILFAESNYSLGAFDIVYNEPNMKITARISTEDPNLSPPHHSPDDDDIPSNERNPAYPTIRNDDFSRYGVDTSSNENEDESESRRRPAAIKEDKILPDVLELKYNSSSTENSLTAAPSEWLKQEIINSTTDGPLIDNVTHLKPQIRAPGEPHLIPEWERNTTSITLQQTSINITDDSHEDIISDESQESYIIGSGSGSGSGDGIIKERESTTENSAKILDPDSLDDGSGGKYQHDPKEDAESLKYDADPISSFGETIIDPGLKGIVDIYDIIRKNNINIFSK